MLHECNRLELKRQLQDKELSLALVSKLQNSVKEKYPTQKLNISEDHVSAVLNWAVARITTVEDLVSSKFAFLWILPSTDRLDINRNLLEKLVENLEVLEAFEQDNIKANLREFSENNGVKFPDLMKMLRSVLSGLSEGPGVAEMMHLLGKSQSLERIKAVVR